MRTEGGKRRSREIEEVIQYQINQNHDKLNDDEERMSYELIYKKFEEGFSNLLQNCKNEQLAYRKLFEENKTHTEDYAKAMSMLDKCTHGLSSTALYIDELKEFGNSLVYEQEEYCLNECELRYNEVWQIKECARDCVKYSYYTEKSLDKALAELITKNKLF